MCMFSSMVVILLRCITWREGLVEISLVLHIYTSSSPKPLTSISCHVKLLITSALSRTLYIEFGINLSGRKNLNLLAHFKFIFRKKASKIDICNVNRFFFFIAIMGIVPLILESNLSALLGLYNINLWFNLVLYHLITKICYGFEKYFFIYYNFWYTNTKVYT